MLEPVQEQRPWQGWPELRGQQELGDSAVQVPQEAHWLRQRIGYCESWLLGEVSRPCHWVRHSETVRHWPELQSMEWRQAREWSLLYL